MHEQDVLSIIQRNVISMDMRTNDEINFNSNWWHDLFYKSSYKIMT